MTPVGDPGELSLGSRAYGDALAVVSQQSTAVRAGDRARSQVLEG
ncbi:hypothetical protein [Cellulomonas fimi]|nr:hypothetical protein [Cellulomonas fimi]